MTSRLPAHIKKDGFANYFGRVVTVGNVSYVGAGPVHNTDSCQVQISYYTPGGIIESIMMRGGIKDLFFVKGEGHLVQDTVSPDSLRPLSESQRRKVGEVLKENAKAEKNSVTGDNVKLLRFV